MVKPIELDDKTFDQAIARAQPVLVDFWAAWCGPCHMLAPMIDELAQEYEGKVNFGKVNVDNYPQLAGRFGIRSIPTLIIFQQSKPQKQLVGFRSKGEFRKELDSILNQPQKENP